MWAALILGSLLALGQLLAAFFATPDTSSRRLGQFRTEITRSAKFGNYATPRRHRWRWFQVLRTLVVVARIPIRPEARTRWVALVRKVLAGGGPAVRYGSPLAH